ncbi:MAG: insulinase family protein [Bacteroidales bacterium]|nr:insulinase family protein [Bacteroidales bacterium]
MLKFYVFVFLLLGATVITAQRPEINFVEFDLENGLHVILHQDNSSPVVAINIMYHVGSKNEKPDRTGFAHFFEHLMFEGSENIDRGEYFKLVQNAGGRNNAYTSFDITTYFEVLPSNQLELGLWLESERLLHLKIDSVGVETQRRVVKEERKASYENQPYGSFLQELFSNAYTQHPYRWVPIGEVQYIDQATISEFNDFYNHFYVPNNAVLVIAGDIQIEQTRELVKKYFSEISKKNLNIYRPKEIEPQHTEETRKTVYDNIQLPGLFIGYHVPSVGTNDYYALEMLQTLLSGGQSSRLYKELVDNQQKALQVVAVPLSLEDPGLFIVLGIANMGVELEDLEESVETEITKVKENLISEKEFEKLKNQTENEFINSNSTYQGIAISLSEYYTIQKNPSLINTEIDNYLSVTREDIQRVAKQYLTPENRVVLYYLPKSQETASNE